MNRPYDHGKFDSKQDNIPYDDSKFARTRSGAPMGVAGQPGQRTGLRDLLVLAERNGGVFTTRQARSAGVSERMLSYYVKRGDIERLAYGIYRFASLPRHRFEDVLVACLWVGSDAAASHGTALVIHGLSDVMPARIHVSTPDAFTGKRRGVMVHQQVSLPPEVVTTRDGLPVTTVLRTLSDVAADSLGMAHQALQEALDQGLISTRGLQAPRDEAIVRLLEHVGGSR